MALDEHPLGLLDDAAQLGRLAQEAQLVTGGCEGIGQGHLGLRRGRPLSADGLDHVRAAAPTGLAAGDRHVSVRSASHPA